MVDLTGLQRFAEELISSMPPGCVVWLSGDLGSGKTTFVRSAVSALGGSVASSPTYALVHEYPSPDGVLFHVDCYRLNDPEEAIDIDFPELQRVARVLFVEWPDRAGDFAPSADIHLRFDHVDDPDRRSVEHIT